MKDKILSILKTKLTMLQIEHPQDEILEMVIDESITSFKNYTRQTTIPKQAYYLIADMSIHLLEHYMGHLFNKTANDILKQVNRVSVGDTDLSLNSGSNQYDGKGAYDLDNYLLNTFRNRMQVFRKVASGRGFDGH